MLQETSGKNLNNKNAIDTKSRATELMFKGEETNHAGEITRFNNKSY